MKDRAREIDVAEHLQVPGIAPDFVAGVVEVAGRVGAGIVDENVDPGAGLRETLLVLDAGQVGAVDADVDPRRGPAQLVARLLERGDAAAGNVEVAAFSRQRLGDREADALAGAGHQGAFAVELQVHLCPPIRERPFRRSAATIVR